MREMVPFCEHLRADEEPGLAAGRPRQRGLERAPPAGRIRIDTDNRFARVKRFEGFLDTLTALAERAQRTTARRTLGRNLALGIAVMAPELLAVRVQRHPGVAPRAFHDIATVAADNGGCEAAPVNVQKDLAAAAEMAVDGLTQRAGQALGGAVRGGVDQPHDRRPRVARPLG